MLSDLVKLLAQFRLRWVLVGKYLVSGTFSRVFQMTHCWSVALIQEALILVQSLTIFLQLMTQNLSSLVSLILKTSKIYCFYLDGLFKSSNEWIGTKAIRKSNVTCFQIYSVFATYKVLVFLWCELSLWWKLWVCIFILMGKERARKR